MTLWQRIPIDIIETLFNYLDINSRINFILSNETLKDVIFKEEYIQRSLISVYFKTLNNNLTDSSFNSLVLENILHYSNNFIFDEEFFKNIHLYIYTCNNINDLSYGKKYFPNTIPCHCSASYAFHLNGDVVILDCSNYLICAPQNEQLDYNRHFSDINFFKYNGSIKEMSRETTTAATTTKTTTKVADAETTTTTLTSELKNSKAYTLVKCNVEWPNELVLYRKIKIVSLDNTIIPLILNIDQIFPIFYNSFLLVSDSKSIYILEIKYARCEKEKCEEDNMEMEVNNYDDDDYNYYNNNFKIGSNLDLTNIVFKKYISNIFESLKTIDITEEYSVVYLQISNNEHTVLYLKKSKYENNKTVVTVIGEKKILYCEKLISFNMDLGIFFYNTEFASRLVFLDYDIDNINNDVNACIKTTLFSNKKIFKAVCLSKYIYLTIRRLKLTIVKVSANLENRLEIESYTNLTVYDDNGNTVIVNDISFIENSKLICLKLFTNKIFFTTRLLNCFLKHEENNFEEYERNTYSDMRFYKNNLDTEYINFFRVPSFTLPIPLEINCLKFGLVKFYEYNGNVINSNTMQVYKTKLEHLNSLSPYRIVNLDGEMNLKIY